MTGQMGLIAAVSILAGCASTGSRIPYESYGPEEARCASVRQFTPLHERGTSEDPNAARNSPCRAYPQFAGPDRVAPPNGGLLAPFRAFFDAADTD